MKYCEKCRKAVEDHFNFCVYCGNSSFLTQEQFDEITKKESEQVQEIKVEDVVLETKPVQTENINYRMVGFGKGLTSTILSFVSYFFVLFSLIFITVALEEDLDLLIVAWFFFMVTLGLAIPGLVLGIKSINISKLAKKNNQPKPIPTFVLGIVGVAAAGLTLFFAFIAFLLLVAAMSLI